MNLTPKEIAYLLPSFTERTAISLFSNIQATPDGTEHDKLVQKGVIQGGGYAPDALDLLLQIANPKRCARVYIKNEFFIVEKYTYWNNGRVVLAENRNGEFAFSKIENFSDVIIGLSEFFGMSNIKTSDVDISLPIDEMLVLLAIIDIYRRNTMLNYAGKTNSAETVTEQEIIDEMSSGFENGLVKILVKNYKYSMPDTREALRLLASLVDKKCLISDKGYKLEGNYALLATSFLIPESVVLYEAFEVMDNGDIPTDGGLSITAGVHDIVTFVFNGDKIGFYSFSAFQMLTAIEKILSCPALAEEVKQPVPPPPTVAPVTQPVQQNAPPPVQSVIQPVQQPMSQPVHPVQFAASQPARPMGQPPIQPAPAGRQNPVYDTWQCACGRVNKANFCAACGRKKP